MILLLWAGAGVSFVLGLNNIISYEFSLALIALCMCAVIAESGRRDE